MSRHYVNDKPHFRQYRELRIGRRIGSFSGLYDQILVFLIHSACSKREKNEIGHIWREELLQNKTVL